MREVIKYATIAEQDNYKFVEAVNKAISEGWQPFGAPTYIHNMQSAGGKIIPVLIQALVQYAPVRPAMYGGAL